MSLADQLNQLHELHQRGALTNEEFARAKEKLLGEVPHAQPAALIALNSLRRSRTDRWVAGVCGGLARATGTEAWVWRLAFALLSLCGGAGLLIYALLWVFVPPEQGGA